ncbi:hypothetical protein BJ742DRAFT_776059 [Cladochytrium replicatum]|nr:hypothetical protein BJ742DRAFT_776059 [Cladochytrium replicatum]
MSALNSKSSAIVGVALTLLTGALLIIPLIAGYWPLLSPISFLSVDNNLPFATLKSQFDKVALTLWGTCITVSGQTTCTSVSTAEMFSGITKLSLTAPNLGSSFSAVDTTSIPNAVNSVYTGNPLIFILILGVEVLYLFSIITAIVGVAVSNSALSWVCVGLNGLAVLATAATFALSFIIYVRAITPAVATLAETLYNLGVQANLANTALNTDTATMLPTTIGISIILVGVAMGLALFAFGAFIRSALIGGHRGSKVAARHRADLSNHSRTNNTSAASNRRPNAAAVTSEPNMDTMPFKSSTYRNQQQSFSGSSPATPNHLPLSIKDPSSYRPGATAANTSSVPSSNYYYYPTQQQNTSATSQYYYYPTTNANATSANYTAPYNSTTATAQNTSGTTTAYGSYGNEYQMYGYYVQPAAATAQDDRRNTYATAGAGSTDESGSGRGGTGTLERRGQARNNQFNYSVYEPARYTG